jgi:transposase
MDYCTRKLLGLTDENLFFEEEWLDTKKVGDSQVNIISAKLTYIPTHCRKCGIINEGQIIKNGTHKTKVQLLPFRSVKTELLLVRSRFYCKECQGTFNAQTNLVDENCYLSNELKHQIALELAKNTSRKEIAERYFVSDVTILRVMHSCLETFKPRFDYLPSVLCFDEFKSMKSCSGKMSFVFMNGHTNQLIGVLENRRLAFLKAYFLKFTRKARAKVKYIVMDMNAPYFELAKKVFPNAQIVTDRFHIIQQINRSLNQLRVQTMHRFRKSDETKYKRFKRFWKLLLKDSFQLDSSHYRYDHSFRRPMTQKAIVDELLDYDEVFRIAYETCQTLYYHFKHKDGQLFFDTINSLNKQLPEWFCKKLTFLNKYKLGVQNALKTKYSNGALEGTNNKIKVIKRVAYGYRNFLNFRARIYIIQGRIFQVNTKPARRSA